MNPFDFLGLGIPDIIGWTWMGMLLFFSGTKIYFELSHKFSKECRNCGKYAGKQMICDSCYKQNQDIFPSGWKNKK